MKPDVTLSPKDRNMISPYRRTSRTVLLAASLLALSACSSNDNDNDTEIDTTDPEDITESPSVNPPLGSPEEGQFAFFASRSSDFGSGRVERISLDDNIVSGSYPATLSDITVDTDGENVYEIGRFNLDSVTRYDPVDTSIVDYQISVVEDDGLTTNPQSLVFIDETKGYLTRRSSNDLLIIDPNPETDADFIISEIDLGAYDTDFPDMTDMIIVDDRLFVLMENLTRLESGSQIPERRGFIAVFDTRTDIEIETNQSPGNLRGIELLVTNPTALQFNEETGEIYVVGRGNFFESPDITTDFHSGGIEVIDPTTFEHSLLLDDGTDDDNEGFFVDAVVINPNLGYLLTYAGFDLNTFQSITTLRTFNPTTGVLLDTLFEGLQDVDITVLAEGPDNHLWVGINDATPGFIRIDLATGEIASERVATSLIPIELVFVTVPAEE